jgi:hypothetical protein
MKGAKKVRKTISQVLQEAADRREAARKVREENRNAKNRAKRKALLSKNAEEIILAQKRVEKTMQALKVVVFRRRTSDVDQSKLEFMRRRAADAKGVSADYARLWLHDHGFQALQSSPRDVRREEQALARREKSRIARIREMAEQLDGAIRAQLNESKDLSASPEPTGKEVRREAKRVLEKGIKQTHKLQSLARSVLLASGSSSTLSELTDAEVKTALRLVLSGPEGADVKALSDNQRRKLEDSVLAGSLASDSLVSAQDLLGAKDGRPEALGLTHIAEMLAGFVRELSGDTERPGTMKVARAVEEAYGLKFMTSQRLASI